MVESRIEDVPCRGVGSGYTHFAKLVFPSLHGIAANLSEIPCGHLGPQISHRIVGAHGRKPHSHQQRHAIISGTYEREGIGRQWCHAHWFGKLGREIDDLIARPSHRPPHAHDGVVVGLAHHALPRGVPSYAHIKVEQQLLSVGKCSERIAVHATPLGGGEFYHHPHLVEIERVVARSHVLIAMREHHAALRRMTHGQE